MKDTWERVVIDRRKEGSFFTYHGGIDGVVDCSVTVVDSLSGPLVQFRKWSEGYSSVMVVNGSNVSFYERCPNGDKRNDLKVDPWGVFGYFLGKNYGGIRKISPEDHSYLLNSLREAGRHFGVDLILDK